MDLAPAAPVDIGKDFTFAAGLENEQFSTPAAPQPPSLPADLASELAAYDSADPTRAAATVDVKSGEVAAGAEEFLTFLEADEVEEHHH